MRNFRPEGIPMNPHDRGKKEWDDRMGGAIQHAKNWRLAFFSTVILVVLPLVVGLVITSQSNEVEPYIIEVNTDGSVKGRGKIGLEWDEYTPHNGIIIHTLRTFVERSQTIPSDRTLHRNNWRDIYAYTTRKANQKMRSEWQRIIERMESGKVGSSYVEIESVVPLSDESWQVDWIEKQYSLQDELIAELRWRGTFQVKAIKPENLEGFEKNPMGIYISEFHFTEIK